MISVIIPMYNAEKTIINALNSIKAQTSVQITDFEIIIINDGSTDNSRLLVEDYMNQNQEMKIQLINKANGGVSSARNAGLSVAKGNYIALLDADDIWMPEKTQTQIKYFEDKEMDIDFLATARNNNKILFPYTIKNNLAEITFKKLLIRNEAQPSTVIFRKKVLENTGYFDEDQRYAEDVNYWMKVSLHHRMYILNESLVIVGGGKRSFGVSGLSANLSEMRKGFEKNLKEMHFLGRITWLQYGLLKLFYKMKYVILVCRTFYNNIK
ncbi:glycosyltransferase [Chryseobacterium daecheongense]|uniref:glycosyltransferase family 2 protein n=1 Tax=Chryseobacterium daecheongense TaxID=192389 RepID=UPI001FD693F6|nr:glycosyltransferase family 2 protein [Chryseobacterium daecheongense]UOU98546.1 glycosyltransferase [Chryseobacterium daecheongense]